MNRETVLRLIRAHEAELKALGIVSVSLFGSTARDEADPASDVDIAVRLDDHISGFEYFGCLDEVQQKLTSILGSAVDVIPEPTVTSKIRPEFDRDRQLAF